MEIPAIFKQVNQLGIVTTNLEKMVEIYKMFFNIPQFLILERKDQSAVYNGDEIKFSTRTALAQVGNLQIEINHVFEGETPHTEWIRRRGEGIHHLGSFVDDIDEVIEQLRPLGFKPFFTGGVMSVRFAYMDTESVLGFPFELIQLKRKKKARK
ncbi:MAG: VOC family protein [Candidatus Helarchaeota archaeon]